MRLDGTVGHDDETTCFEILFIITGFCRLPISLLDPDADTGIAVNIHQLTITSIHTYRIALGFESIICEVYSEEAHMTVVL